MKRFPLVVLATALLVTVAFAPFGGASPRSASRLANSDDRSTSNRQSVDKTTALVQLVGDPLSTDARTTPAKGKKIDFDSAAVKSVRARLSAERNDFKQWLKQNAPRARVTGHFDISLNAVTVKLNGESLSTIRSSNLVVTAQYENLYYPTNDDPDLSIIHALEAWDVGGGPATAGDGVKVAIVDTGIDQTHPCFDDAGYPEQQQLGDTRFTNNKVIAAKVFYNKAQNQNLTAEAIQDHGTHVAGTVGCNYLTPAEVSGVDIPYDVSGVAPRALLGNYNVFPGEVLDARSEDILNALDAAYQDGFDVANMSLGGDHPGNKDLLTDAVDDLDQANMVVAVAAGNSGPGHYTVESPGSAARALTAGASTVPHFVGAPVTVDATTYSAAIGDFELVDSDLTAPLAVVTGSTNGLDTACSTLSVDLTGTIALISRGTCTFSTKIRNAQDAGAAVVLVANNVAGDPIAMAEDGTPNQPTVPAYMVSFDDGQALLGSDGASTTVGATLQYFLTTNVDIMAGFSSQGPTDVDFRVKPDLVAPGVNVLSSVPGDCGDLGCWAFFQGTSMATPHLAGGAAVVIGQHPDWSAAQVRSAIVNTADLGVLKDYLTGTIVITDPNIQGAGRENLLSAVQATVGADPVSASFGAVPAGSGQTKSFVVSLTNLGDASESLTFSLSSVSGTGVSYSVSPSSLTLGAGDSGNITITATLEKRSSTGDHQSYLSILDGGVEVAHMAVYTLVK
jgi:minor extracellular serine protease Vpr